MSHVIKSPRAERDLVEHFARIALDKIDPAIRFLEVAEESFELLSRMPGLGRAWESKHRRLVGLHVYPFPRGFRQYLVFYREIEARIEVIRVLHGARDLEVALQET